MTYNEQSRRDTVKDYRPQIVRLIKYKPKADEQVLYFANRKLVIVKRKMSLAYDQRKRQFDNYINRATK